MKDYIKQYEEKIDELQQDLNAKEDIINQFHETPGFSRLIDISQDELEMGSSDNSEPFASEKEVLYNNNETLPGRLIINKEECGLHGLMSGLIETSMIENENLKESLDISHKKISSF